MTDFETIKQILQEVTLAISNRVNDSTDLWDAYFDCNKEGLFKELDMAILDCKELKIFEDASLCVGDIIIFFNFERLREWLVIHSMKTDTNKSISAIQRLLLGEPFFATAVLALARVSLPKTIQLGNNVTLCEFSSNEFLNQSKDENIEHHEIDVHHISAAITVEFEHPVHLGPRGHYRPSIYMGMVDEFFYALQKAYRALLILGIVRPQPPALVGHAIFVPLDFPGAYSKNLHHSVKIDSYWPRLEFNDDECSLAKSLFESFENLSPNLRDSLFIPMSRLRSAMTEFKDFADAAIDLGIALESILIKSDESTEITYRISMRGARLLGKTLDERLDLKKKLTKIYGMRSKAAHRGIVQSKSIDKEVLLLREGFNLTAKAIQIVLTNKLYTDKDLD